MCLGSPYIFATKPVEEKEKIMEQVYRIGIDHGYGNIKTAHHIFESGIIQRESVSELAGMVVEYEGKFYEIGSTHKEYQMDKVWDEDYYILTLAALAKELRERGLCYASVILAVGLPIKWLGEQAESFKKYLLKNKEVTFRCNDTRYHVKIEDVEVYAQGFAAVAADLPSYQGFNIVADIGNGNMNVIFIVDGKPDSSRYYTERFGVECCVIEMRSELTNKVHTVVDDCIVKKVLKDGTADIGEKYLKAIAECATDYTDKIMRKLREYGYNEELAKLHFLGGGAMLMKHFAKLDHSKVHFIEDIHANAKGYEYLSNQRRLRNIRRG